MKTASAFLLLITALLSTGSLARAQLSFENPIGPPLTSAHALSSDQFLGARFTFTDTIDITAVAATFVGSTGNLFAAVVELQPSAFLPAGIPFAAGEVVAHTVFQPSEITGSTLVTVPLSAQLTPGTYGIVFGSGQFGASGYGGLKNYAGVAGSSSFFYLDNTASSGWNGWDNTDYDIIAGGIPHYDIRVYANPVPEPGTWGLAGAALLCLLIGHRRLNGVRAA